MLLASAQLSQRFTFLAEQLQKDILFFELTSCFFE
ncbi:MAG: hypothetical protein RL563_345 [Pseudomonadota bacterium]|jgi:hypothetical protein